MCYFVRSTDRPSIVPLITGHQIARVPLIPRVADAPSYVVGVPQIIRYAIIARAVRASVELIPVKRSGRFPHRRTEPVSTTLRLLPELIKGPAVGAARGALELFTGEALEQGVTNTVTCCSITVASVRTF